MHGRTKIGQSYPALFRHVEANSTRLTFMPGWLEIIVELCREVTALPFNADQEPPFITELGEENGRLIFKAKCADPLLQYMANNLINKLCDISESICMMCGADSQHQKEGFERTLCIACERDFQRRQFARFDYVTYTSSKDVERIEPLDRFAIISIATTESSYVNLKNGWHSVHRAIFHETDPLQQSKLAESNVLNNHQAPMTDTVADAIVDFVHQNSPHLDGIVVHSMSGDGCSAAIVKWIAEAYALIPDKHFSDYNKHVYLMLKQAGERQFNDTHPSPI